MAKRIYRTSSKLYKMGVINLTNWYGDIVPTLQNTNNFKEAIEALVKDAKKNLTKGSYFEIRLSIFLDFGRRKAIAWYHDATIPKRVYKPKKFMYMPSSGTYLKIRDKV